MSYVVNVNCFLCISCLLCDTQYVVRMNFKVRKCNYLIQNFELQNPLVSPRKLQGDEEEKGLVVGGFVWTRKLQKLDRAEIRVKKTKLVRKERTCIL